jgi:adenylosuccinate synthase
MVRVGGPNSGHTTVPTDGRATILRQLPTGALLQNVKCVLPAGTYLDLDVLLEEIYRTGINNERLAIDPWATVIGDEEKREEAASALKERIGSTGSGTGGAIRHRVARDDRLLFAKDVPKLQGYLCPTVEVLRPSLDRGERVLIEGTQGFGLSLLHSGKFPFVTSRDTTAAAFLSECGVSPLEVDAVIVVLRAFPIRVSGNSGPLENETSWQDVATSGGHDHDLTELTSVTKQVRRVGRFDSGIARLALEYNRPTSIVLNHLDYLDHECCESGQPTAVVREFVDRVEHSIGRPVDLWGLGPNLLITRQEALEAATTAKGWYE